MGDGSDLPEMKFDRGFTGHEHLEMFGLINMNARLYDPVLGRFLSPDPIIQVPEFTQSYNGYSYALNNPLSYKDPNGESFILVAAIIGGWIGLGTAMVSSDKSGWGLAGDMLKGLFVGAASGAAGAWAGGAVAGSITAGGFSMVAFLVWQVVSVVVLLVVQEMLGCLVLVLVQA